MRDLNLGPDTKKLIEHYKQFCQSKTTLELAHAHLSVQARNMAAMLERWVEAGWCWVDACPAWICNGPHVMVRYRDPANGKEFDIIEPVSRVGTTFEGMQHAIVTGGTNVPSGS
jgi:hypothetical protein